MIHPTPITDRDERRLVDELEAARSALDGLTAAVRAARFDVKPLDHPTLAWAIEDARDVRTRIEAMRRALDPNGRREETDG